MFAWYYPITMTEKLSILCLNVYLSPKFYSLSKYLTSFATALSILLYIPVIILARRQMKAMRKKISETQVSFIFAFYLIPNFMKITSFYFKITFTFVLDLFLSSLQYGEISRLSSI